VRVDAALASPRPALMRRRGPSGRKTGWEAARADSAGGRALIGSWRRPAKRHAAERPARGVSRHLGLGQGQRVLKARLIDENCVPVSQRASASSSTAAISAGP
jgi:hypothetical protein